MAGHDGRRHETPSTAEVRDILDPLGFDDAKVSTLSGSSGESVRVQAEIVEDPIRTIQGTLADAADLETADVLFVRNEDGSGTFTLQTADRRAGHRRNRSSRRSPTPASTDADGHGRRPERDTSRSQNSRRARCKRSSEALAEYAGVDVSEVSVEHRRADVGRDREPEGAPGARHLLRPARASTSRSGSSGRWRRPRSSR